MNPKIKRIFAIISIILLIAMYLLTLVFSAIPTLASREVFQGLLLLDLILPIFLWLILFIIQKHTKDKSVNTADYIITDIDSTSDDNATNNEK